MQIWNNGVEFHDEDENTVMLIEQNSENNAPGSRAESQAEVSEDNYMKIGDATSLIMDEQNSIYTNGNNNENKYTETTKIAVSVPDSWNVDKHIQEKLLADNFQQASHLFRLPYETWQENRHKEDQNSATQTKKTYSIFVNSKLGKSQTQTESTDNPVVEELHVRIKKLEDLIKQLSRRVDVLERAQNVPEEQYRTNQRVLIISDKGTNFKSERFSKSMKSEMLQLRDCKALSDESTRRRIISKERITNIVIDMGNFDNNICQDSLNHIENVLTYLKGRSSAKYTLMIPLTNNLQSHQEIEAAYRCMIGRIGMSTQINILNSCSIYNEQNLQIKDKFLNQMARIELIRWNSLKAMLRQELTEMSTKPMMDRKTTRNQ